MPSIHQRKQEVGLKCGHIYQHEGTYYLVVRTNSDKSKGHKITGFEDFKTLSDLKSKYFYNQEATLTHKPAIEECKAMELTEGELIFSDGTFYKFSHQEEVDIIFADFPSNPSPVRLEIPKESIVHRFITWQETTHEEMEAEKAKAAAV